MVHNQPSRCPWTTGAQTCEAKHEAAPGTTEENQSGPPRWSKDNSGDLDGGKSLHQVEINCIISGTHNTHNESYVIYDKLIK